MFRTRYIKSLMIAAAAVAAACTADPVDPTDPEGTDPNETPEPASLTINFSIADLGVDVSTRAAGDLLGDDDIFTSFDLMDPDHNWPTDLHWHEGTTDPGELAENKENWRVTEAALVEGSKMTCLTVILINYKENKIVGIRRIPDPDCPNHNVVYLTGDQEGEGLKYPPASGSEAEAEAKENCILKKDGSLAEVYRNEDGTARLDDENHIIGLVGSKACVTFNYNNPKHIVDDDMLKQCAKNKYPETEPDYEEKRTAFIAASNKYIGKSAEKLTRGEYTLLVIANYDHNVTTSAVEDSDLTDGKFQTLNVDKTLEKLTNDFHEPKNMANGISDFTSKYEYLYDIRFLMNHTLEKIVTQTDGQTSEESYNVIPLKDNLKPYIRPAVHQTLTAAKDIYLSAGNNVINIELQRIASRTRVEVKNYASFPLKVHSLKFSPNYTQSTCYLFRRNKNDRDYKELATNNSVVPGTTMGIHGDHDGKGAPMVNYTGIYNYLGGKTYGAIVPFIKDWDTDDPNGDGVMEGNGVVDGVKVEPSAKKCIFDALMYESSLKYKDESHSPADPDSFTYTIEVSYPDVTDYETPDKSKVDPEKWNKSDPNTRTKYDSERAKFDYAKTKDGRKDFIHDPATPEALHTSITALESGLDKSIGESLCFLIQGASVNKFLREKEGGIMYADLADVDINTEAIDLKAYLWVMDELELKDGKCYCYLKNLRSGKYMSVVTESSWPIENSCIKTTAEKPAEKCNVTIGTITRVISETESYVEHNVMFSNTGSTSFLNIWGGQNYLGGYEDSNDPGSQYRLYPIKLSPTLVYIGTPWMRKEVELTAFSDKTGFVEKVNEIKRNDFIRILVEVSYNPDKSDFDFKVNSWKTGGGNIDFH